MLGLLPKTLKPLEWLIRRSLVLVTCSFALARQQARGAPDQDINTERPQKRIELEFARGIGTKTFGGNLKHDLSLIGIKFEEPFTIQRYSLPRQLHWNISLFSGARDHPEGAYLVGLNPGVRYYLPRYSPRIRPFVEASLGIMLTDIEGPDLGSKFQFNEQIGLGLQWSVAKKSSVNLSYRLLHISNAGLRAPNRGVNTHLIALAWSRNL